MSEIIFKNINTDAIAEYECTGKERLLLVTSSGGGGYTINTVRYSNNDPTNTPIPVAVLPPIMGPGNDNIAGQLAEGMRLVFTATGVAFGENLLVEILYEPS